MNIIRLPIVEDTAIPKLRNIFKVSTIVYLINQDSLCYWNATDLELKRLAGISKQDELTSGKNILLDSSYISLLDHLIIDNLNSHNLFTTINLDFSNSNYLPLVDLNENSLVHGDVLLLKENGRHDYCKLSLSSNSQTKHSSSFMSSNKELNLVEVDHSSRGIYFNGNGYTGAILIGDFFKFNQELSSEIRNTINILKGK